MDFNETVERSFADLQDQVFKSSRFYEFVERGFISNFDELFEDDDFMAQGTHSILDIERLATADSPDSHRVVRLLSDDEVLEMFGSRNPSVDDFREACRRDPLWGVGFRWTGRATLLYDEVGAVARVAFWGWSGD